MLLPPIRSTGAWPGARARRAGRRAPGRPSAGSRPVYWCSALILERDARGSRSGIGRPGRRGSTRWPAIVSARRGRSGRRRRRRPSSTSPSATVTRAAAAMHARPWWHTARLGAATVTARDAPVRAVHQTVRAGVEALRAHRSGRHHRLLGRREVDGDGRLRGRGLLLRRQPALGDDPLAGRAVHARGLQGRPRRGRLRRARRQLLRGAGGDARRPAGRRRAPPGAVPGGRRADAADPLQGDPPPPSARARRAASPRGSPASASCWRRCASAPTW